VRRLGILALVVSALLTITTPAAAAQSGGPTYDQLFRALLTEDDLWERDIDNALLEADAGELDRDYPAVYADFSDLVTDEFLSIELHDARNGVPDYIALAFVEALTDGRPTELRPIAPTGFGTAGVRYRYIYHESDGDRWYGEVAAWRQGQVVVAIVFEGSDADACVCDLAALQYNKVASMIR